MTDNLLFNYKLKKMNSKKFLVLVALLCTGMLAQAQVKLSFNPEKGATYSYRFNTDQSIKQTFNGQTIPVNTTVEMLMEMNVKEKSEEEVSVDYSYKEMVMNVSNPMMNIKYDSKTGIDSSSVQGKLIAGFFNSLIGKTMNVILKPDGSVKSISGFNAILEDIQKNTASDNPAAQPMINGFLQAFNEDAMKRMFEQSFKMYPDKEVNVGDSWNSDMSFTVAGMNSNIKNTYTLQSVSNGIALIEQVSDINIKPGAGMDGELTGNQKGEISLDVKTGLPVKSTATQSTKGKLNIQGTEVLMDMTTEMTFSLIK